jgi:Secretion system C-terminal sorting domain
MKTTLFILFLFVLESPSQVYAPAQSIFMQGNNINTCFRTDGISNFDKVNFTYGGAGFIWPAASNVRQTAVFTTGIWIGAKVGPQRELRMAASGYLSHYSPGNIPVIGQVPHASVCSDPSWRGYLVNLNDPALTNGGFRTKTAGGGQYSFTYDAWANWPVSKGAPFVEVNGIPGYQPSFNGDRPGIGNGMTARPEELLFMVYMDYTNCTNNIHLTEVSFPGGTLPLGIEVRQLSFMFSCQPLRDMYFTKYIFINRSQFNWDSTYIALFNDIDIGSGSCGSTDDAAGCDTAREMAFAYNGDNNDCNYGTNPPSIGYRYLQSPLRFTGSSNDTAKLPYDTLTGYRLTGLTSYYSTCCGVSDPCLSDPDNAAEAFEILRGKDICGRNIINPISGLPTSFRYDGDACSRIGWFDSIPRDVRDIASSGPFTMNISDTQIVVLSYMITRDGGNNFQNVCALQSVSDSALYHYYHDFRNCIPIGIQPISNEIPQRFELYQNYPNPFNPITKLKFQIPKSDFVNLRVFDVTGKEIVTLVNEQLKPGIYEIDWDASNYPSGVYFYSFVSGSYTLTRKMVLLK